MKIIYTDLLCEKGHKSFNINMLRILSSLCKIDLIIPNRYLSQIDLEKSNINELIQIPIDTSNFKNKFDYRFKHINAIKWLNKYIKRNRYDAIIISGYDIISFSVGRVFIKSKIPIYLIHHNNIDQLTSLFKRCCFDSFKNSVHHIVLEEMIGKFLVNEIGIPAERVHVVNHPTSNSFPKVLDDNKEMNLVIGLSNSNDETLVKNIIDLEKKDKLLTRKNIQMVLKSKKYMFDNGNLRVINGFISDNEYRDYYNRCSVVLIPFPSSFKNRMSGTLIDALSAGKKVIGSDIPIMRVFSKKYPDICKVFYNVEDMLDKILDFLNAPNTKYSYEKFVCDYSDEKIAIMWDAVFKRTFKQNL